MAQGDPGRAMLIRHPLEEAVTKRTGGILERSSTAIPQCPPIDGRDGRRNPVALAMSADEVSRRRRLRSSQAVVHMSHMQGQEMAWAETKKKMQERHRINTARDSDNHSLAPRQHPVAIERLFNFVEQRVPHLNRTRKLAWGGHP